MHDSLRGPDFPNRRQQLAFIQHGTGKRLHPSELAAEFGTPIWLLVGKTVETKKLNNTTGTMLRI